MGKPNIPTTRSLKKTSRELLKSQCQGEQLPHSTTPINSPAKSKKKIDDCRYNFNRMSNFELKVK